MNDMKITIDEGCEIAKMAGICYSEGLLSEGAIRLTRRIVTKWPSIREDKDIFTGYLGEEEAAK